MTLLGEQQPAGSPAQRSPRDLGDDFRRLWTAYAVSQAGSAIGYGALPLVALLLLDATAFQVSLLAGLSGIASAVLALRLGRLVEFRRKRPMMMTADLVRFVALVSVPAAGVLHLLTYAQLCVVGVVATTGDIAFTAASGVHLKALVPDAQRLAANSRVETTFWIANAGGPPLGTALVSWLGASVTMLIDAVSYLGSAIGLSRLRTPEPPPPRPADDVRPLADMLDGWRCIFGHRGLAALFWNAMLFGGCLMLGSPLLAVLMLRDLGLGPWAYGVASGVPCLAGLLGALWAPRVNRRLGARSTLLTFGVLRSLWMVWLAVAPSGLAGLLVITLAETGLLLCAGVFNPTFVTYRMRETPDGRLARVQTAWSISSKTVQPAFVLAGGVMAGLVGTRITIAVAGGVLLLSGLLLPWRSAD